MRWLHPAGGPRASVDPITFVIQAAFYVLFGAALWRYLRRPGAIELAVVAVFSTTAALFLLSTLTAVAPALGAALRPLAITALVAQPYLIVRLIGLISPVPRWAEAVALIGFVASAAALILFGPGHIPTILLAVAYFAVVEAAATVRFARMARRRLGLPRARLTLAAIATACFGLAIVAAGAASAVNGGNGSSAVQPFGRALALVAALGYVAAFLPPRWLTRLAHRAVAFELTNSIVALETTTADADPDVLWRGLRDAAAEILGSPTRIVRTDPEGSPDPGTQPAADAERPSIEPLPGGGTRVTVPLSAEGERALLTADLDGRPLFVDDDLEVVALLGSLTVQAVAHERAVHRLRETLVDLQQSAAVRASEARFRALLEAHPNAVLAIDEDRRVSWCTHSTAELFAASEDDIVGLDIQELVSLPRSAWLPDGPDGPRRLETTARRLDRTSFPAEIALSQFELEGRPSTLAIVTDVTWRRDADLVRDRFIGVLSHELRTPITSIYGGAQVLAKRAMQLDEETRNELLVGLADESERLQRMIENLLILARVEKGAEFFGPRPVLLDRVLAEVIERERVLWPSATIQLSISGHIPVVSADEDHLAQIMRNLLANAVKYAGDRATVTVEISHDDPWVTVLVRDDGPGFPADEADRIFNLYYRSASSARAPGAGIGLFVCRQLVEAMGGRMWASTHPGEGATIGFRLGTYVEEEVLSDPAPSASSAQPSPSVARIAS